MKKSSVRGSYALPLDLLLVREKGDSERIDAVSWATPRWAPPKTCACEAWADPSAPVKVETVSINLVASAEAGLPSTIRKLPGSVDRSGERTTVAPLRYDIDPDVRE